jgi:hypothetical protein
MKQLAPNTGIITIFFMIIIGRKNGTILMYCGISVIIQNLIYLFWKMCLWEKSIFPNTPLMQYVDIFNFQNGNPIISGISSDARKLNNLLDRSNVSRSHLKSVSEAVVMPEFRKVWL